MDNNLKTKENTIDKKSLVTKVDNRVKTKARHFDLKIGRYRNKGSKLRRLRA